MSNHVTPAAAPTGGGRAAGPPRATGAAKPPKSPAPPGTSREAKQRAAAILEVLAGGRTPPAAAAALGVSLARYYLLEEQALRGLVAACEPQPKGRAADPEGQRVKLERERDRWQREAARQQALVRAAQRTIGLAAPATPAPAKAGARKRRPNKPVARALKAVAGLRREEATPEGPTASTTAPTTG